MVNDKIIDIKNYRNRRFVELIKKIEILLKNVFLQTDEN